jgi:hypothetical protein
MGVERYPVAGAPVVGGPGDEVQIGDQPDIIEIKLDMGTREVVFGP